MGKSKTLIAFAAICLMSCSNEEFCDCLEAGNQLDQQSTKILKGDTTQASYLEQTKLLKRKNEACKDFEEMDGAKLIELRDDCESK